jgi:hypothetical protein
MQVFVPPVDVVQAKIGLLPKNWSSRNGSLRVD